MLKAIDHIVITARDVEATARFYSNVLMAPVVRFGDGRIALQIGVQKINLHGAGREIEPKAESPTPGAIDLCFLTDMSAAEIEAHLDRCGVEIVLGPVFRSGAMNRLQSIYIRDPDGNLVEIAREVGKGRD